MDILADTDNSLYLKPDNRYVGQICIYFLRAWLKKSLIVKSHIPNTSTQAA